MEVRGEERRTDDKSRKERRREERREESEGEDESGEKKKERQGEKRREWRGKRFKGKIVLLRFLLDTMTSYSRDLLSVELEARTHPHTNARAHNCSPVF